LPSSCQTLRTFEVIDSKTVAAASAKWSSLKRERVASKLEEKKSHGNGAAVRRKVKGW